MVSIEMGDRVHYVLQNGAHRGECRGATIIRVVDPLTEKLSLLVLTDGLEDGSAFLNPEARLLAHHGADMPGRWHLRGECLHAAVQRLEVA